MGVPTLHNTSSATSYALLVSADCPEFVYFYTRNVVRPTGFLIGSAQHDHLKCLQQRGLEHLPHRSRIYGSKTKRRYLPNKAKAPNKQMNVSLQDLGTGKACLLRSPVDECGTLQVRVQKGVDGVFFRKLTVQCHKRALKDKVRMTQVGDHFLDSVSGNKRWYVKYLRVGRKAKLLQFDDGVDEFSLNGLKRIFKRLARVNFGISVDFKWVSIWPAALLC